MIGVDVYKHVPIRPIAAFPAVRQLAFKEKGGPAVECVLAQKMQGEFRVAGRTLVGGDHHVQHMAQTELVDGTARFSADSVGIDAAIDALRREQTETTAEVEVGDGIAGLILPAFDI